MTELVAEMEGLLTTTTRSSSARLYKVSELGRMCNPPVGGVIINRRLDVAGLQRSYDNGKDPSHEITDKGREYGQVLRMHTKHTGLKDYIIRWDASVLNVI